MKVMKTIVAFLLVSLIISCHQSDNTSQLLDNHVSAKRNNVNWIGSTEIRLDSVTDTLTFLGIANRPNDEVIVIKIKFTGAGSYSLTKSQGYYYSTVGGDVLTSEYGLAQNTGSQMIISKYDQSRRSIEGSFEMSLKKKRSNPENNIDTYNFTQGSFKGKISN
jgi:hypothetical protein